MTTIVDPGPAPRGLLTVPNAISVVRLCCIPLFLYVLFGRDDRASAAWLLGALGATDWVDGYIARRWNQISDVGKVLDPAADRLLFIVGITGIIIDGSAPIWVAVLILVREAVVGGAMVVLTVLGMKRFDVTYLGKCATFALMFAFPLFLLGASDFAWHSGCQVAAWICVIPGLLLSYYTAIAYVPKMRQNLVEGRADRRIAR